MNRLNIYQRRKEVHFHGFVCRSINLQIFIAISRSFYISPDFRCFEVDSSAFLICILVRLLGKGGRVALRQA